MQAVILVGGLGTRLRPITYDVPKALVPLRNRPFMGYMLDFLRSGGLGGAVLSLGYLPTPIQEYLADFDLDGFSVDYAVERMALPPGQLIAYLGPGIGPRAFEVGADVRDAFLAGDTRAEAAFAPHTPGKWLADLFLLARQALSRAEVASVHGGALCTHSDALRFYSYRRMTHAGEADYGRVLSEILEQPADGILDGRTETFVLELPLARVATATAVQITVEDTAGNPATVRVEF